jgi:putative transposase
MNDQPRKAYTTDLSDVEWAILEPLMQKVLNKPERRGRPLELSLREIVNASRYVLRNGVQWRDLPSDLPAWQSVYYHFAKWRDMGLWQKLNKKLRRRLRKQAGRHEQASLGLADSQAVKGTVHAGNGFDGGKKTNGRKRHVLVDTLGLLLVVIVTKANVSDQAGLKRLLAASAAELPRLKLIKADEAYRGHDFIAWVKRTYKLIIEIVSRPEGIKGFVVQPQRWVVERTLAWLYNYRRLSKDYELLTKTSEAFIYLAMVDLMTKRLANCSTPAFRSR